MGAGSKIEGPKEQDSLKFDILDQNVLDCHAHIPQKTFFFLYD
jgi:hypothetical protein